MSTVAVVAHTGKLTPENAGDLRGALARANLEPARWYEVSKGPQATDAARRALKHGADTVIVCGGDGTVRAASEAIAHTSAALAVLPAGTANLFASGLDLPSRPDDVVKLVVSGSRRIIDTGCCNGVRFGVMSGTGLDAAMMARAEDGKERLGTLAYVRAGLQQAKSRTPIATKVRIDGTTFFEGEATCVLVGNLGRLKGGIVAFPDASVHDGQLDVAVLTATGLREWADIFVSAVRRKHDHSNHATLGRGGTIAVRLGQKQRYELDGGPKGQSRKLDFTVDPSSLIVCAPAT